MSLIPREEKFFDLFERSTKNLQLICQKFKELVENYDNVEAKVAEIRNIEHESDIIVHEIMDKLNRSFITPFDREDIQELAKEIDEVADFIQATADRFVIYRIDKIRPDLHKLQEVLMHSIEDLSQAVTGLRDMKRPRRLLDFCIEINRHENEGDKLLREAISRLFDEVKDPIAVIKWKEILENLEIALDKCEDVANIIEGIVIKHA